MASDDGRTWLAATLSAAHAGFYPYVLGQLLGCLHEFVPSSRLNSSSPATFPWTSMIRCALSELLLEASILGAPACVPSPPTDSARSASRPRFLDSAFKPPAMRRLAPCRQVRRVQALPSAGVDPTSPGLRAPVRFFDDPQLIRRTRTGGAVGLSTTSGSAGAAALRLASPDPVGRYHSLPFSLAVPA